MAPRVSRAKLKQARLSRIGGGGRSAFVQGQVGVFLQSALVVREQFHGIVRLQAVGLDRGIDLEFYQAHELDLVPLRQRQNLADSAAFDDFLNVPAALFIGIEEDVHLGDTAKEVVQVAHDVLVGADHEDAKVIHFAGADLV